MQGGPAQPRTNPHSSHGESPDAAEWYAVTGNGSSALRIAPGLTVGESPAGALALNDPEPACQWIEFDLSAGGEPSVAIITREKSLLVDGTAQMRGHLNVGATIRLPNNTLYISRDIRMPRPAGRLLEVVPRQVPDRPQDLVAPGWEEALEAVRGGTSSLPSAADLEPPGPATDAGVAGDTAVPESAGSASPRQPPPRRPAAESEQAPAGPAAGREQARAGREQARPDITVAEPFRPRRSTRRQRAVRRRTLMLSTFAAVVALAGVAAVLFAVGWRGGVEAPDAEVALGDVNRPAPEPAAPPADDPAPQPHPRPGPQDGLQSDPGTPPAEAPPTASLDAALAEADRALAGGQPADGAGDSNAAHPSGEDGLPAGDPQRPDPAPETPVAQRERGVEPAELRAAAPQEPAVSSAPADLDWRLIRARKLMESGYITFPPEDNAVAYLERLLAEQPNHPQALALLGESTSRLIDAAVRAHDQGLEYEARNTLEEVFGFSPDHPRANRLWREWVKAER